MSSRVASVCIACRAVGAFRVAPISMSEKLCSLVTHHIVPARVSAARGGKGEKIALRSLFMKGWSTDWTRANAQLRIVYNNQKTKGKMK